MSDRNRPSRKQKSGKGKAEAFIHALRTHQVDAIIGERHIMLVRLKRAEEDLRNSRNQLRALVASLQSIREEERANIGRDIHDDLGQKLASLELGLSWLARKLTHGQQPLRQKIGSLSVLVTTMIQAIGRIADELRPNVLDELGLVKTLQSEAREFERHTEIRCRFETNIGNGKLNRAGSVAILRIVQAAFTNIVRHAEASRARVTLIKKAGHLILTVSDNGKGITKKLVHNPHSLGISGMRERAIALKGRLSLRGSKGKGTTVTLRVPLSQVRIGDKSVSS